MAGRSVDSTARAVGRARQGLGFCTQVRYFAYPSAQPLARLAMPINSQGFRLLPLVAACMLLSAWLPAHFKLWFVSETGHISSGQTLNLLLLLLLFGRWRHAITLALFVNGLQCVIGVLMLHLNWKNGGPLLGYGLMVLLHLVVLKVLHDSRAVRAFLHDKPLAR
jgi:hypothetical protein